MKINFLIKHCKSFSKILISNFIFHIKLYFTKRCRNYHYARSEINTTTKKGSKKKRVWDGSLTIDGLKVNMIRFFLCLIIFIDQSMPEILLAMKLICIFNIFHFFKLLLDRLRQDDWNIEHIETYVVKFNFLYVT